MPDLTPALRSSVGSQCIPPGPRISLENCLGMEPSLMNWSTPSSGKPPSWGRAHCGPGTVSHLASLVLIAWLQWQPQ